MKPSSAIHQKGEAIRETARRFRVANPRIFGSVLHGKDVANSDRDVLVDPLPGITLFDLGGLPVALEELLSIPVDRLTPEDLSAELRNLVVAEAHSM